MQAGRYIEVSPRIKREIQAKFGVTQQAVSMALSFQRKGGLSKEIRDYALVQPEAKVMRYTPECETIHDHEGIMTQTFSNGWTLRATKSTGLVEVFTAEGKEDAHYFNPSITRLSEIQKEIEAKG